jgi:hypothetical protein
MTFVFFAVKSLLPLRLRLCHAGSFAVQFLFFPAVEAIDIAALVEFFDKARADRLRRAFSLDSPFPLAYFTPN